MWKWIVATFTLVMLVVSAVMGAILIVVEPNGEVAALVLLNLAFWSTMAVTAWNKIG